MKFLTQHRAGEVQYYSYDMRSSYNTALKLASRELTPRTMIVQEQSEASNKVSIKDLNLREIDEEVKIRHIEDLKDLPIVEIESSNLLKTVLVITYEKPDKIKVEQKHEKKFFI